MEAALEAALGRCVVADRSDLARIAGTGRDLAGLLHRLSTQDLTGLVPGEGRVTVLTSPKGRIVQRLWIHDRGASGLLLVGGAGEASRILEHLGKYTFREETGLADLTDTTRMFVLAGPEARAAAAAAGLPSVPSLGIAEGTIAGASCVVVGHDGDGTDGIGVVVEPPAAPALFRALVDAATRVGGCTAGADVLEARRILLGFPTHGRELTEDWNPLEAGLRDAVSFTKGCYVGQEVVARLNTYDKVARRLAGLVFPDGAPAPAAGASVGIDGRSVGIVTSAMVVPGTARAIALAMIKTRDVPVAATEATVGEASARLVPLPIPRPL